MLMPPLPCPTLGCVGPVLPSALPSALPCPLPCQPCPTPACPALCPAPAPAPALPFSALSSPLPHSALLCPALRCPALPFIALPCPASPLPRPSVPQTSCSASLKLLTVGMPYKPQPAGATTAIKQQNAFAALHCPAQNDPVIQCFQ